MSEDVDFSEVDKLAEDLGQVPANAGPFLLIAMRGTALGIKKAAAASVATSSNQGIRSAGKRIDFDVTGGASYYGSGSLIEAEVGYPLGGAGSLGGFREFGASGSAPHMDLAQALHGQQEDLVRGLSRAIADAEAQAGL